MRDLALELSEQEVGFTGLSLELQDFINIDKSKMETAVIKAKQAVEDGNYDPLKGLIYANKLEKFGKELTAALRPIAEGSVTLAKGEVYKTFNTEVTQKETGVSFDLSICNDPVFKKLSDELTDVTLRYKERETFLKSISKPMTIVDEETGDIIEIKPPIRKGKLGLALSIK